MQYQQQHKDQGYEQQQQKQQLKQEQQPQQKQKRQERVCAGRERGHLSQSVVSSSE